jgi:UDP:flavonoid glycosyltransferase YjiC (YdhE family)
MSRAARLASDNVRIEHYVDQWRVLQDASIYVTHQGLNSTHEAIYHGVPMLSYPFFWDQPGLAARCQDLGVAMPIVDAVQGPVTAHDMRAAFDRMAMTRALMRNRIAQAREWELETIRARPAVIERVIGVAS